MIKLIQIIKSSHNEYRLANVYLNPKHIVFMSECHYHKAALMEGKMNLDLETSAAFTKIKINEMSEFSEITVVGDPEFIRSKIQKNSRNLLRG